MAKYLEIIGDNNKVIIDDQNARLHLTRSYSLSHFGTIRSLEPYTDLISDNYWLIAKILVYEIQLNSNEVFFSIRALASNENVGFARCAVSAKKSYLYCYINKQGKNSFSASNFIIDFYGTDASYTEHGSGLQIFDATGNNVVFDSNRYYMDVKGYYNIPSEGFQFALQGTSFWPDTINIGGHSINNSAVIINSCKHFFGSGHSWTALESFIHCVVFGGTIYLRFWYLTTGRRLSDYTPEQYMYDVLIAGNNYYPHLSINNSGVILDTTNIS